VEGRDADVGFLGTIEHQCESAVRGHGRGGEHSRHVMSAMRRDTDDR